MKKARAVPVEVVAAVAAVAGPALRAKVLPPRAQQPSSLLLQATAPSLPRAQARALLDVALAAQLAARLTAHQPTAALGIRIHAPAAPLPPPQHPPRQPKSKRCTFPECHSCLSSNFPSLLSK